ncbi:MAG: SMC-Scp complex subunit ScpB [Candidatus Eisenbacteria bacterium]|jgi:segregation and condensation protein B|nr:SMC-Scp complex subunit ScpB [Candidatus Eisenbacteria bacterium]
MSDEIRVEYKIECLVLASGTPLGLSRVTELLNLSPEEIRAAAIRLNEANAAEGRSFTVEERGGVLVAQTRPAFASLVRALREEQTRLSPALLHTLAAVAYRQPVTRAEIEALRGVDSGHAIGRLTELGMVRMAGRADKPGRPLLYRTTDQFLIHFGLPSIDDLPSAEELRTMLDAAAAGRAEITASGAGIP